jgi:hypothetical protein
VAEAIEVLHGIKLSIGSVSALQHRVSQSLQSAVEQTNQFAGGQVSQNVDETSWPEAGKQ